MQTPICPLCQKPIKPNDDTVSLDGDIVHRACADSQRTTGGVNPLYRE